MSRDKKFRTVRGYWLRREGAGLSPSMEDYLEMIYRTCLEEDCVRVQHLADLLNVKAPSVSRVLRKLRDRGLVKYHRYGIIQLTDGGRELGKHLMERHRVVEEFLENLGVTDNLLLDTELIEHDLSRDTLARLKSLNAFLRAHPEVLEQFRSFRQRSAAQAE